MHRMNAGNFQLKVPVPPGPPRPHLRFIFLKRDKNLEMRFALFRANSGNYIDNNNNDHNNNCENIDNSNDNSSFGSDCNNVDNHIDYNYNDNKNYHSNNDNDSNDENNQNNSNNDENCDNESRKK